tara:strand:+ start:3060 stop:3620 length:561 start_codon:yes stop_codon:yes gene_type:complete
MLASEIEVGMVFKWLTVKGFSHKDERWRKVWDVECRCGEAKKVLGSALVSGNTKSCGCYASVAARNRRISKNHSEVTAVILGYKRHAKDRGLSWELSRDDVESVISMSCKYCGSKPSNVKRTKNSIGGGLKYSGIDRVDSGRGYTIENIVPACKICNYAKSNMSIDEFASWAKRLGAMATQWGQLV